MARFNGASFLLEEVPLAALLLLFNLKQFEKCKLVFASLFRPLMAVISTRGLLSNRAVCLCVCMCVCVSVPMHLHDADAQVLLIEKCCCCCSFGAWWYTVSWDTRGLVLWVNHHFSSGDLLVMNTAMLNFKFTLKVVSCFTVFHSLLMLGMSFLCL